MITSGSANVVKYFYLFFFRAKNVGCEVRRCARQRREKITTIKGSGNWEDLWSWILFRGCANHSGFIPEKARRPVQSSAELLFFSETMQQLFSYVLHFKVKVHMYAHWCAFQSSFSYMSMHILHDCKKSWLQQAQEVHIDFYFSVPPYTPLWDIWKLKKEPILHN